MTITHRAIEALREILSKKDALETVSMEDGSLDAVIDAQFQLDVSIYGSRSIIKEYDETAFQRLVWFMWRPSGKVPEEWKDGKEIWVSNPFHFQSGVYFKNGLLFDGHSGVYLNVKITHARLPNLPGDE